MQDGLNAKPGARYEVEQKFMAITLGVECLDVLQTKNSIGVFLDLDATYLSFALRSYSCLSKFANSRLICY